MIDGALKVPKKSLIEENYNEERIYSNLKILIDLNSEKFGLYLVYDNSIKRKGFKYNMAL